MIINLLVALFNMLPLGFLDGGRFFYLTFLGLTGSEKVAKGYIDGGASGISVLTDNRFFGGSPEDLKRVQQIFRATSHKREMPPICELT